MKMLWWFFSCGFCLCFIMVYPMLTTVNHDESWFILLMNMTERSREWMHLNARKEYLFGGFWQLVRVGSYLILSWPKFFWFPADADPPMHCAPPFFDIEYLAGIDLTLIYSTPGKTTWVKKDASQGRAALSQAHVAFTFNPEAAGLNGWMCLGSDNEDSHKHGRFDGENLDFWKERGNNK